MEQTVNFYELLELSQTASPAEIKKAYARKIRQYPSEQFPEQFQQIRKAYETLSNEQSRTEYNRYMNNNGMYGRLIEEANQYMDSGNFQSALNILKQLLSEYPDDSTIAFQIVVCQYQLSQFQNAKRGISKLILEDPQNETYRLYLARINDGLGDDSAAASEFEKLIRLNRDEVVYYLEYSYVYTGRKQFAQATFILQRYMNRKKHFTLNDFPILSELYFLTHLTNDQQLRQELLYIIQSLPTNDSERTNLCYMLIDSASQADPNHPAIPEMMHMIETINRGRDSDINKWLLENSNFSNDHSDWYDQSTGTYSDKGSLAVAIIVGIILSILATPFVGIIAGIIYYYKARQVHAFLKGLGCFVLIVIGIIFFIAFL